MSSDAGKQVKAARWEQPCWITTLREHLPVVHGRTHQARVQFNSLISLPTTNGEKERAWDNRRRVEERQGNYNSAQLTHWKSVLEDIRYNYGRYAQAALPNQPRQQRVEFLRRKLLAMLDQQADLETMLGCCNEVKRMGMHRQACQLQGIWNSLFTPRSTGKPQLEYKVGLWAPRLKTSVS